jgi:CBS domain-containing protein
MAILGIFSNPWLILIALFVYIGANEEERLVLTENILGRVRVEDVMSRDVVTVSPEMSVSDVIDLILKTKHLGFPVVEGERVVGIVTLHDLMGAEPEGKVREVMSKDVVTLPPEESAFEAFKIMSERGIGRLPVTKDGKIVGIVSRSDLMRIKEILEAMEVMGWKRRSSS